MFTLRFRKAALKGLARMPRPIRMKMLAELAAIASTPHGYQGDWKPLAGSPFWRLRVGGYRAICDVQGKALVLLVLKTGPPGDVYK